MDELHLKFTGADGLSRFYGDQLGGIQQPVLLQLQLDEPGRQPGTVDGHIDLLEHVGDGADVILVPVGDEHTTQSAVVLHQIADVGDDAVDAVHIIAGESHTTVHHDDLTAIFVGGHVLADLIETAKRDDLEFFCHK